jgi:hypothetical protein
MFIVDVFVCLVFKDQAIYFSSSLRSDLINISFLVVEVNNFLFNHQQQFLFADDLYYITQY